MTVFVELPIYRGDQKSSNAITMTRLTTKRRTLYSWKLCCVAGNVITVRSCILECSIKHISIIEYLNRTVVQISQSGWTQANNTRTNTSFSTVLPISCRLRVDFRGICQRVSRYAITRMSNCVGRQMRIRSNRNCCGQVVFRMPKSHQLRDAPYCRANLCITQRGGHFKHLLW